jgi:tetratricopeptide (TPR) repeat protein
LLLKSKVQHLLMAAMLAHTSFAQADPIDCKASYVKALDRTKFPSAVDAFVFYKSLQPGCASESDYLSHLASLANIAGRRTEGENIIKQGLARSPNSRELLFSQGYIFLFHADLVDAEEIAQRLIRSEPAWFGGYAMHQRVLMDRGDFREALRYSEKALSLSQGSVPTLFLNDAVANYYAGNLEKCVQSAETAIDLDKDLIGEAWGVDEAIYALAQLGRKRESFELAQRRKAATPNWRDDPQLMKALTAMGIAN